MNFLLINRFGVAILASLGLASNKFREVLKLRLVGDSGNKAHVDYLKYAMRPDDDGMFSSLPTESRFKLHNKPPPIK